ncbi:3D domain-containing protein [Brevibacillus sp. WF146]|uniref:3D domain-containing protein n=1 Tax=Brevibacillus sp. WF146 TaxID=319501 RepID=UPI0039B528E1
MLTAISVATSVPFAETELYEVTAYSVSDDFTPAHGITASGERVREGVTAACPPELPFGTRVHIEGVGERVCQDRGGAIKGRRVDVYIADRSEALRFGRRKLGVTICAKSELARLIR